jgi:uncharacterized damage-inducible protein DinB
MDIMGTITELYRHMEWADASLWTAVMRTPQAVGDAKLKDTLHHLHMVQYGFLAIWGGVPPTGMPQPKNPADAASLCGWAMSYHASAVGYLKALDRSGLDGAMVLPWADEYVTDVKRKATPTTLGETLLQVTMHSMHHRGQAASRLRAVGGEPPTTDFIMWAWLGKPAPAWPV